MVFPYNFPPPDPHVCKNNRLLRQIKIINMRSEQIRLSKKAKYFMFCAFYNPFKKQEHLYPQHLLHTYMCLALIFTIFTFHVEYWDIYNYSQEILRHEEPQSKVNHFLIFLLVASGILHVLSQVCTKVTYYNRRWVPADT